MKPVAQQDGTIGSTPITMAEHIVERVSLGQGLDEVAKSANTSRQLINTWRRLGAAARAAEAGGQKLDVYEQGYRDFVDALERAETDAEWRHLLIWIRGAEGGGTVDDIQDIYEADARGNMVLVRRVVTKRAVVPKWEASRDFLERRFPERYRKRSELTGADGSTLIANGGTQNERARELVDAIELFRAGAAMQAEVDAEAAGQQTFQD